MSFIGVKINRKKMILMLALASFVGIEVLFLLQMTIATKLKVYQTRVKINEGRLEYIENVERIFKAKQEGMDIPLNN